MVITNTFHSQDVTKYLNRVVIRLYEKDSTHGGDYRGNDEERNEEISKYFLIYS